MAKLRQIVVDCERAAPLARFWADVLDGFDIRPYDDEEIARLASLGYTPETDPGVIIDGPGLELCFQEVPEKKVGKIRMHLDIEASDLESEVARLLVLGATIYEAFEDRAVMQDPEGNEFCVFQET